MLNSEYDLIVHNGSVVDGTGRSSYRADIGVKDGQIVAIGRIREKAAKDIDASGYVVSPGFIDGHTHLDVQMHFDPLGQNSCWLGVTTAVIGNCGFTLAPMPSEGLTFAIRNMERAEDIPKESFLEGIEDGKARDSHRGSDAIGSRGR